LGDVPAPPHIHIRNEPGRGRTVPGMASDARRDPGARQLARVVLLLGCRVAIKCRDCKGLNVAAVDSD
jgi:hypothetical protein